MTLGVSRVIYNTQDLSIYTDEITRGYVIALIQCERGELFEPIPLGTWDEFERECGRLITSSVDPLVIKMGMQQGAKFIVIRLAHCVDPGDRATCTAVKSEVTLFDRGGTPTAPRLESVAGPFKFTPTRGGTITGAEVGPFSFVEDVADTFTIAFDGEADQEVTLVGTLQTVAQVVDQLNAGTTGLTFSVVLNHIKIDTIDSALDFTVKNGTNNANAILGIPTGVYASSVGNTTLIVSINDIANQTFDFAPANSETGDFYLTAGQAVAQMTGLTGATASALLGKLVLQTTGVGDTAWIQIQVASTADTVMGLSNTKLYGTLGTSQACQKYTARTEGAHGNSLRVIVYDSDRNPNNRFDVRVVFSLQSGLNEYYQDMTTDPNGDRYFVNWINERSRLVRVTDLYSTNPFPTNRPEINQAGYMFSGGDDGLENFGTADWVGDELAMTGIYAANKVDMAIDIMIPGTTNITVLQALAAYCETRGDLVSYANTPVGLTPLQAVDWRMGSGEYSHEPFNSHRMTLWFGRPLVYNSQTDSRQYIPNLGHLAACLSKTDERYNQSFAPVGPRRGVVDFVEGMDFNLADYRGYEDLFAEKGINGLKITQWEGAVFWEQRTTQLVASAFRDLNVVRFLTVMRKVLIPVLRTFIDEPNHPMTWREVKRVLDPQFRLWKNKYEIYDYVLQCDEGAFFDGGVLKNATLNSGLEIDQGIYRARGLVQPTRAIYYVMFDMGVTRTGQNFAEYTVLKELPGWVRS